MSQPLLAAAPLLRARIEAADALLIALDFDGTLAPIVPSPRYATLPRQTEQALKRLAALDSVTVAIISGRSLPDLTQRCGAALVRAGEHGLEIAGPCLAFHYAGADMRQQSMESACAALADRLSGIPGVSIERKRFSATVHFRQALPEIAAWIEAAVWVATAPYLADIAVLPAKKAWELRPRVQWDKGSAVHFLLQRLGAHRPLLICAGDDAGDEAMFEAAPDAISIKVGDHAPTTARYHVDSPAALADFLWLVAESLSRCESATAVAYENRRVAS